MVPVTVRGSRLTSSRGHGTSAREFKSHGFLRIHTTFCAEITNQTNSGNLKSSPDSNPQLQEIRQLRYERPEWGQLPITSQIHAPFTLQLFEAFYEYERRTLYLNLICGLACCVITRGQRELGRGEIYNRTKQSESSIFNTLSG
ncbi:hypothetical protein RRG08_056180 [Elysia crispata]|uniref:Uncharacterized protein n=1 Tax=Elysia crispata TaxID=231223 RepID=A0AAE1D819_9GAST|nr:hypothetical protein RRG08_056180 [Elysia crispata]